MENKSTPIDTILVQYSQAFCHHIWWFRSQSCFFCIPMIVYEHNFRFHQKSDLGPARPCLYQTVFHHNSVLTRYFDFGCMKWNFCFTSTHFSTFRHTAMFEKTFWDGLVPLLACIEPIYHFFSPIWRQKAVLRVFLHVQVCKNFIFVENNILISIVPLEVAQWLPRSVNPKNGCFIL